jgi:Kef-type K+ transport system membrane component KefB/nucleotide-binding universal stress UspA family protein
VEPLTEHQLLILWIDLLVLVVAARTLGSVMQRFGQPAVVGELAAGLILGPSVLGRFWPTGSAYLFPIADPVQSGLVLSVAWIGVALLMVVTGFETDLQLLSRLGRSSFAVSVGSLVVPLAMGYGLGLLLPTDFLGAGDQRTAFALFMAVALSISSLPVVAKILLDMNLMRRNVGQVIVAAGMANDLVGWILLGLLAGIVTGGGFDLVGLLTTVGSLAAFLAFALTVGQRFVDAALRRARRNGEAVGPFTVLIVVTLAAGAFTQAIGVEAVLGAFVGGILLGRSRYRQEEIEEGLKSIVAAFFAPVFFATAGLSVDIGLLADPRNAAWAVVVIAVAAIAKFTGTLAGAKVGGMRMREGLAVGVGLNARGALEIVVATVGFTLGILNATSYTVVVVMAMTTSIMAPPLLRKVLTGMRADPAEQARLEREAMLEGSVIAHVENALLPTRGGSNSVIAARLLDLALQPDTAVTIYTAHTDHPEDVKRAQRAAQEAAQALSQRGTDRVDRFTVEPARAICEEAALGYGLVALGMSANTDQVISPALQQVLSGCPVPMLLVRQARSDGGGPTLPSGVADLAPRRVLVPATGTRTGQAAQEIAYTLSGNCNADVRVVHVVDRPDRERTGAWRGGDASPAQQVLAQAVRLAARFGLAAQPDTRTGTAVGLELVKAADEADADVIVVGTQVRSYQGRPFLGHVVEYLMEHANQVVVVLLFPERSRGVDRDSEPVAATEETSETDR